MGQTISGKTLATIKGVLAVMPGAKGISIRRISDTPDNDTPYCNADVYITGIRGKVSVKLHNSQERGWVPCWVGIPEDPAVLRRGAIYDIIGGNPMFVAVKRD